MPLKDSELEQITQRTLSHYGSRAEAFWAGTRNHDVSQNIEALLGAIEGDAPFTVLDLGCGPGRDLKTFRSRGHRAVGLEGAPEFVEMARHYSGCEVWQKNLLALDLPSGYFDGVFANAVLFHVPTRALARVLADLYGALKPRGVLFTSNPRGDNSEGWSGDRYGAYHDFAAWRSHVTRAGFEEILHYYRPEGLPREQQPWLASLWRKL